MSAPALFYGDELVERIEVWRCWRALLRRPPARLALTRAQIDSLLAVDAITLKKAGESNGEPCFELYIGALRVVTQTRDQFTTGRENA